MKILADQNIDRATARRLAATGLDIIHTSDLGFETATDPKRSHSSTN